MKYSIADLTSIFLPKNIRKTRDNLNDFQSYVAPPAYSVRLFDVIKDTVEYLNISPSVTDLSTSITSSTVTILSSTGTDAAIPAATTSTAGAMTATDKVNLAALITLSGVAAAATNLGTFTGTIIPDNSTIKAALQSLETSLQSISYTLGNLTSSTAAITVTGGSNAVIGSGASLTLNPASILLSTLGGTLDLDQISTTGASSGDVLTFNGSEYEPLPVSSLTHNSLSGLQGGASAQYYHLTLTGYNAVESFPQLRLAGRDAVGTGVLTSIALTGSLEFTGSSSIHLVNDSASPGNSYYYGTNGSGVKGWYASSTAVTSVSTTDSVDIDFTTTNPTTTPSITGVLTATGVTAGAYGTPAFVSTFTVDTKGRLSAASSTPISISASQVSNFTEAMQDALNTTLVAGSNITLTYNDPANTLTIASTISNETIDDRVAALLVAGSGITLTYNDPANTLTITATGTGYSQFQDDGTNLTQRTTANFEGYGWYVTDDSINTRTSVQLSTNLQLYASLTGVGMIAKDGSGVAYAVEIVGGTGISVASGFGVLGDPTISLDHLGIEDLVDPGADRILFWDDSAGASKWLTLGTNLSISGTTLNASGGSGTLPPTATTGDFLYYDSFGNWVNISPQREMQTSLTGTTVTLAATPANDTPVLVYLNGILQEDPDNYSIAADTITFTFSLVALDKVTAIYYT